MPRKVFLGVDYDYDDGYDDYDAYEEYDMDNHHGNDQTDISVVSNPEIGKPKPGVWRCSICTYDNDETMTSCDICGVIRLPPANSISSSAKNTVPFQFDVPSPDDVVISGLHPSKRTSKGPDASSSKAHSSKESANNAFHLKEKYGSVENGNSTTEGKVLIEFSDVGSDPTIKMPSGPETLDRETNPDSLSDIGTLAEDDKLESVVSGLRNTFLSAKPESSKRVTAGRTSSSANYKPEKWMLPENEEEVQMEQLNLAIVGHVDSGKSTLSGRLLHLLGKISRKDMHKFEKEAKMQGKGSFAYAWALDESAEERERGITMTVAVAYFDTKRYHVVVLDSPGHKDFVPNMISGATQADAGILVVDASVGSFEAGMESGGGQTREHAQLIRSFGVNQIIVAVNKMDAVNYSKERFELIKKQVGSLLRSCHFKDSLISWVPLSAMENQNLIAPATDARLKSWYQGHHILSAIDSLRPPTRDYSKPLLMPICDVIKTQSMGQVSACGKLEFGAVRNGSKVLVMPSGNLASVKAIECNSRACCIARSGDNVAIGLLGIDAGHVTAGGVLCHPDFPVKVATRLELKILVLDVVTTPILIGSQLEFHIHHAKEAARIVKIVSLLDPKTGKITKKAPRCLLAKQNAVVEVALQGPVCAEEFSSSKALGRVFLRASGKTICVGVVTRVFEEQE